MFLTSQSDSIRILTPKRADPIAISISLIQERSWHGTTHTNLPTSGPPLSLPTNRKPSAMTRSVSHLSCLFRSAGLETYGNSHLTFIRLERRLGWQRKAAGVVSSSMPFMHALRRPQQQPSSHVASTPDAALRRQCKAAALSDHSTPFVHALRPNNSYHKFLVAQHAAFVGSARQPANLACSSPLKPPYLTPKVGIPRFRARQPVICRGDKRRSHMIGAQTCV